MLIVFCDYIGLHHNHTYFTWCLSMVFLLDCNQEFCHQCYWVVVDDYLDGRKIPMNEQENSMRRNWHGSSNVLVWYHLIIVIILLMFYSEKTDQSKMQLVQQKLWKQMEKTNYKLPNKKIIQFIRWFKFILVTTPMAPFAMYMYIYI